MPNTRPPRPYDPAIGAQIVARIDAGEELRDLWRDPTLPGRFTLKRWRHEVPAFSRAVRAAVNRARSRVRLARSPYGPETRALVIAAAEAGLTWRQIAQLPGAPLPWSIANWLKRDEDFRWDWAVAREMWMDGQTEQMKALAADVHDEESVRHCAQAVAALGKHSRVPRKHSLGQVLAERELRKRGYVVRG